MRRLEFDEDLVAADRKTARVGPPGKANGAPTREVTIEDHRERTTRPHLSRFDGDAVGGHASTTDDSNEPRRPEPGGGQQRA